MRLSHNLRPGVRLKEVVTAPSPDGQVTFRVDTDNTYLVNCISITVVEEAGQMSMVPWARVETKNGEIQLVNLANVESVVLADSDE